MNITFKCLSCLLVVLAVVSCKKDEEFRYDNSVEALTKEFDEAVRDGGGQKMEAFFTNWERSLPAKSAREIGNDPGIREVYQLFWDLYDPFNEKYATGEWGWNKLKDVEYLPSYNCDYPMRYGQSADVVHFDTLNLYRQSDLPCVQEIKDFRPAVDPVKTRGKKTLYFTDSYVKVILGYMKSTYPDYSDKEGFNADTLSRRAEILKPYITSLDSNWWWLTVPPAINSVYFNRNMDEAIVEYRVNSIFYTGFATKKDGHWKFEKKEETGIM